VSGLPVVVIEGGDGMGCGREVGDLGQRDESDMQLPVPAGKTISLSGLVLSTSTRARTWEGTAFSNFVAENHPLNPRLTDTEPLLPVMEETSLHIRLNRVMTHEVGQADGSRDCASTTPITTKPKNCAAETKMTSQRAARVSRDEKDTAKAAFWASRIITAIAASNSVSVPWPI